jgi:protein tyrosine/serine phosphatase
MSASELRSVAETDVQIPVPPEKLMAALGSPPFIYVPGTFNTRDLGLIPSSAPPKFRSGFAYRSGMLAGLTDDGKALVAGKLGIKKIFDLRSQEEHAQGPDPDIDGISNVWTVTTEKDAAVTVDDFIDGEGEKGYEKMYLDVLKVYQPSFKQVFEHVRDSPEEPFMFHCTGKTAPS